MTKQNVFFVALVAILVIAIIGGYYFPQIRQFGSGTRFINGLSTNSTAPSAGELRTTTLTVDSAATLSDDDVSIKGIGLKYYRESFTSSTSTPCVLTLPTATSTNRFFSINITTATTSALTWTVSIATSTAGYATSTVDVLSWTSAAGSLGNFSYSPSGSSGFSQPYPASARIVVSAANSKADPSNGSIGAISGTCTAIQQEID